MSNSALQNSTIVQYRFDVAAFRLLFRYAWLAPGFTTRVAAALFTKPRRLSGRTWTGPEAPEASECQPTRNGRVSVYCWGEPRRAPYVLLCHGWESDAKRFSPWITGLRNAGFAVVAFDQPGHGESDGNRSSLPVFRESIESLLNTFGPAHGVIAHSMAGVAAALALISNPIARRLVLVSPASDPDAAVSRFADALALPQWLRSRLRARLEEASGVTIDSLSVAGQLEHLRVRTLVIHDVDDQVVPYEEGICYAREITGARLLTTQGLGHYRILNAVDVVAEAIAFLVAPNPRRNLSQATAAATNRSANPRRTSPSRQIEPSAAERLRPSGPAVQDVLTIKDQVMPLKPLPSAT